MESGDHGEGDAGPLEPIVSELTEAAREAHAELRSELVELEEPVGTSRADLDVDVDELQAEIETTRQYVRKLEQYIVALEEQVDDG